MLLFHQLCNNVLWSLRKFQGFIVFPLPLAKETALFKDERMKKCFVYHCVIAELDIENGGVTTVFEADPQKIHMTKDEAITDLRNILDLRSKNPLIHELEDLKTNAVGLTD